jgi:GcrA cell cycle regulator
MSGQAWTPERDNLLRKWCAEGRSGGYMALQLGGLTRNAVIGRMHRIGLKRVGSARTSTRFSYAKPKPKRKSQPGPKTGFAFGRGYVSEDVTPGPIDTTPLPSDPPPSKRVSLSDLNVTTCRWPLGHPSDPDFGFCGAKPLFDCPYCAPHARVAYVPRSKPTGAQNGRAASAIW